VRCAGAHDFFHSKIRQDEAAASCAGPPPRSSRSPPRRCAPEAAPAGRSPRGSGCDRPWSDKPVAATGCFSTSGSHAPLPGAACSPGRCPQPIGSRRWWTAGMQLSSKSKIIFGCRQNFFSSAEVEFIHSDPSPDGGGGGGTSYFNWVLQPCMGGDITQGI
jgi:hypothetical protein